MCAAPGEASCHSQNVGASILHQLGLDDLVATNDDEFVQSEFFVSIRAISAPSALNPPLHAQNARDVHLHLCLYLHVHVCI